MQLNQTLSYRFGIFAICAAYLAFQLIYIPSIWLEVDELWYAHHIYQYTAHLPYLDFPPYKTVLGYYLLMLPLYFVHGVLTPIYFIKGQIAVINTLLIATVGWWAARLFQPRAVFYTLVLILSNQLFLIFSTELRVDMLCSWLCLIAILLLVNSRVAWAGVIIGLAFLTSQKALWYIAGTNLALGTYWLATKCAAKNFRPMLVFNLAMLPIIAGYIAFWSTVASFHVVWSNVFSEAYTLSKMNYYAGSSNIYWQYVLRCGPLLVMLLPLTLLNFFTPGLSRQRFLVTALGLLSLVLIASYRQFFPYNSVFLFPAYFVLFAEFFSWVLTPGNQNLKISQRGLFWFFSVYLAWLVVFVVYLDLPTEYFLVLLVPMLFWQMFHEQVPLKMSALWMIGLVLLFTGVFMPLADFGKSMHVHEAGYQQATISLANELLQKDDYIAGIFIFHDREQSLAGFENLVQPAQEYAQTADIKLLPVLPASLNITPKTAKQMLTDLKNARLKLLVNNVRIAALPAEVLDYLRLEYEHYWGGLYLYAPTIALGEQQFLLKFSGNYTVQSNGSIMLDDETLAPQTTLKLAAGKHSSYANSAYRLRLIPEKNAAPLNLAFQHDCAYCFFKEPLF
ncbi:MAG: hypothetical protein V4501_11430 [Pseudomonadota bacterium]